ncbi:ribbon-helix-helix domain-containing protein [Thermococcus peptonophilus]|uniref:ribbon-helix-helix domain-containing protein n=1 Tax=Thermococcus peptonophilus TaxID=53952 RepID=UPI00346782EA
MSATEKVSIRFPLLMREIDELVENGEFLSRSEFIKEAVRFFFLHYESPEELWEKYKLLAKGRKIPSEEEIEKPPLRKWTRNGSAQGRPRHARGNNRCYKSLRELLEGYGLSSKKGSRFVHLRGHT